MKKENVEQSVTSVTIKRKSSMQNPPLAQPISCSAFTIKSGTLCCSSNDCAARVKPIVSKQLAQRISRT